MADDDDAKTWAVAQAKADEVWKSFERKISEAGKLASSREQIFYTLRLDGKEPKGRLIRLDVVIEATHLLTATIVLQTLPNVVKGKLISLLNQVGNHAGQWVARAALKGATEWATVVNLFTSALGYFDSIEAQRTLEESIRDEGVSTRDGVVEAALKQKKNRGKVRSVASRHDSPESRKPGRPRKKK